MPQLLQRATDMKVIQVKDRTTVRPDCVYVIPPNKDMSILHGVLHLFAPTSARGLRLPVDFFLHSLAQDQQEHSVGVILSGMGSDGTQGLRAIKEQAGLVLVQDPASAKFDSMPRSVVDAGLADVVAPAHELPEQILAYLQTHPAPGPARRRRVEDRTQSALEKVVDPPARPHAATTSPLQAEHPLPPDRAAHGASSDRQAWRATCATCRRTRRSWSSSSRSC